MFKMSALLPAFRDEMVNGKPTEPEGSNPPASGEEKKSESTKKDESEELAAYKRVLLKMFGIEKNGAAGIQMRGSAPLTITKRIMKGVAPPPGNGGIRITGVANATRKTTFTAKPISVKSPASRGVGAPEAPVPKPASVKPGGLLRPGKDGVA